MRTLYKSAVPILPNFLVSNREIQSFFRAKHFHQCYSGAWHDFPRVFSLHIWVYITFKHMFVHTYICQYCVPVLYVYVHGSRSRVACHVLYNCSFMYVSYICYF